MTQTNFNVLGGLFGESVAESMKKAGDLPIFRDLDAPNNFNVKGIALDKSFFGLKDDTVLVILSIFDNDPEGDKERYNMKEKPDPKTSIKVLPYDVVKDLASKGVSPESLKDHHAVFKIEVLNRHCADAFNNFDAVVLDGEWYMTFQQVRTAAGKFAISGFKVVTEHAPKHAKG